MKLSRLALALFASAALAVGGAKAADPQTGLPVTSGTGTTLCAFTNSGQLLPCSAMYVLNASGVWVPISATNPSPVYDLIPPGATAIQGSGSTTGSGALTLLAAPGAGIANNVLAWECWNTSAVTITATFNDAASTQIIVPQTYGNNMLLPIGSPLTVAANTALTVTPSAAETTFGCAVQGFKK